MTIARVLVAGLLLALYVMASIMMVLPELIVITMLVMAILRLQ